MICYLALEWCLLISHDYMIPWLYLAFEWCLFIRHHWMIVWLNDWLPGTKMMPVHQPWLNDSMIAWLYLALGWCLFIRHHWMTAWLLPGTLIMPVHQASLNDCLIEWFVTWHLNDACSPGLTVWFIMAFCIWGGPHVFTAQLHLLQNLISI
jgi:hypothetical protein